MGRLTFALFAFVCLAVLYQSQAKSWARGKLDNGTLGQDVYGAPMPSGLGSVGNGSEQIVGIQEGTTYAFMALLESDMQVKGSTPIIFGRETLNSGNVYNKASGVFRARVPGVYLFNLRLSSAPLPAGTKSKIVVKLRINNDLDISAMSLGSSSQHSETVIVYLAANDRVQTYVTEVLDDPNKILGCLYCSHFAGALIR